MHNLVSRTLGALTKAYYFRQLFFGALFAILMVGTMLQGAHGVRVDLLLFVTINTLLYPYARFAYERCVGLLLGENVFYVNALIVLFVKLMTMAICWSAAIFIAPFGWLMLYFKRPNVGTE